MVSKITEQPGHRRCIYVKGWAAVSAPLSPSYRWPKQGKKCKYLTCLLFEVIQTVQKWIRSVFRDQKAKERDRLTSFPGLFAFGFTASIMKMTRNLPCCLKSQPSFSPLIKERRKHNSLIWCTSFVPLESITVPRISSEIKI